MNIQFEIRLIIYFMRSDNCNNYSEPYCHVCASIMTESGKFSNIKIKPHKDGSFSLFLN